MFLVRLACLFLIVIFDPAQPSFCAWTLCSAEQVMESLASSVSAVPSFEDYFAHNMWNPLLDLFFLEQTSSVFVLFVEEVELAKIELSCHFVFDLLCYKEGAYSA